MRRSSRSTHRATLASFAATVLLTAVMSAPVLHAQQLDLDAQPTVVGSDQSDCAPVHSEALCALCVSSSLMAPTSKFPAQLVSANVKSTLAQPTESPAHGYFNSRANRVRAPPPA